MSLTLAAGLAEGSELGEFLPAIAVHITGHFPTLALAVGRLTALAVRITLVAVAGATVDDHALPAGAHPVTGRSHGGVVGVENHVDDAAAEGRPFHDEIVAQLVHASFVLVDIDLLFDGTEEVGQIFVTVAHIPTLIGEALAGVVDAGKFLLKLFGIEFPRGFDGRGRENNGVSERGGRVSEGSAEEPKESGTTGAVHRRRGREDGD